MNLLIGLGGAWVAMFGGTAVPAGSALAGVASAEEGRRAALVSEDTTVVANIWFVTFDPGVRDADLPLDLKAIRQESMSLPRDERGRLTTWGLAFGMAAEDLRVEKDGHRLFLKNEMLVSEPVPGKKPPWTVVAAPRILARLGQSASISVGRPVPYLVQREDKSLVVASDEALVEGVFLTLTPKRIGDDGIRFEDIHLRVSEVVGRQPIEGVPFDVGPPILDSRETKLHSTLRSGQIAIIPLPQGDGEPPILVFLTARVVPPTPG